MVKLIRSLEQKKYRKRHNMFVAEGHKAVGDMMKRIAPYKILATDEWVCPVAQTRANIVRISEEELSKVSFLQHPQQVIGLFPIPKEKGTGALDPENKLTLALDGVQDPGNLGTIIRLADWFGIDDIVCSQTTADAYNPKVVQATMGSLARVNIIYTDLGNGVDMDVRTVRLLPLEDEHFAKEETEEKPIRFEPSAEEVLARVVPAYITGFLYSAMVDSFCAARASAMDSANQNEDDMLRELQLEYNHERQGAITSEITEVSAGARSKKNHMKKEAQHAHR